MKRKYINLFIKIFFVIVSVEMISLFQLYNKNKIPLSNFTQVSGNESVMRDFLSYKMPTTYYGKDFIRPIEYKNNNKRPIVLFGCSYTEGFGLEENQTFSYKLSNYTNRTVYNFGQSGTGIQNLYYLLSDENFVNSIPKNTEYIIFILIPDHFPRLYRYRIWIGTHVHTLRYKIKNDKLVEDKLHFRLLHSFFTSVVVENFISDRKFQNRKNRDKLFLKLFEESDKIIKKELPKTKFVILCYSNTLWDFPIKSELELLRKTIPDVTIIDLNDYFPELYNSSEYCISDGFHPNEKAWDLIVPFVSQKLQL